MPYILITIFAVWFAVYSGVPQYVSQVLYNFGTSKRIGWDQNGDPLMIPIRLLPFDCEKCLSFWMVFTYGAFHEHLWMALLYAGCASLGAIIVTKLLAKI